MRGVAAGDPSQVQKSDLSWPASVVYTKFAVLVHVCAAASAGIKARRERVVNCIVNTEEEDTMNESVFVSLCVVEGSA